MRGCLNFANDIFDGLTLRLDHGKILVANVTENAIHLIVAWFCVITAMHLMASNV
jgi:hypothetical protein